MNGLFSRKEKEWFLNNINLIISFQKGRKLMPMNYFQLMGKNIQLRMLLEGLLIGCCLFIYENE